VTTSRFAALVTAALAIAPICSAQTPKLLRITSPANGAVVNPGQILKLTVISPANARFEMVALISPIDGISGFATSVPAELLLQVPADISCGKYPVTVDGRTVSGQSTSEFIEVDVERPDTPIQLSFLNDYRQLEFTALGESFHMNVLATFSDGRILDVTQSSRVTYSSSNRNVATVDRTGAITPVGIGNALVSAIYTNGDRNVRIAIPVSVPKVDVTFSSHSLSFGEQTVSTTSAPEPLTLTNTGTWPITVRVASAGLVDFVETNNCFDSTPLAVGDSCTILVSFKPTDAGHRMAGLKIYSSEALSTDVISLSGTGVRR
jgi:Bacterial Ig-like domain (group 2)